MFQNFWFQPKVVVLDLLNHGSNKQVDAPEDGVRKSTETRQAR
jgi:hypothetical protein